MKIESLDELQMYVSLLEDLYEEVLTDNDRIVKLLKKEYGVTTNIHQLELLQEANINLSSADFQLTTRNIMS